MTPVTCKENLLRGETFNAANAAKAYCPQGHPYSGDNLIIRSGRRICRQCAQAKSRAYRVRAGAAR